MARKPKAIEIPGDTTPAQFESLAKPEEKATPQPEAAQFTAGGVQILKRECGWILTPNGWCKE